MCGQQTEACCVSQSIPQGAYDRLNDAGLPATMAGYALERYEVTVGRFRRFVADGRGTQVRPPASGAGANPWSAASGWAVAWNVFLAPDTATLQSQIVSCPFSTWTSTPSSDTRPMNCITWYEAFAFCAWDGARLPTELEWEYEFVGGSSQRTYPWGAAVPTPTLTVFDCTGDGSDAGACAATDISPVGSHAGGDSLDHVSDLAGSMQEWLLDVFASSLPPSCANCEDVDWSGDAGDAGSARVTRGGSWRSTASELRADARSSSPAGARSDTLGFRCAR
jgi:formylglycine-generating enzyme required for sulfatase activity